MRWPRAQTRRPGARCHVKSCHLASVPSVRCLSFSFDGAPRVQMPIEHNAVRRNWSGISHVCARARERGGREEAYDAVLDHLTFSWVAPPARHQHHGKPPVHAPTHTRYTRTPTHTKNTHHHTHQHTRKKHTNIHVECAWPSKTPSLIYPPPLPEMLVPVHANQSCSWSRRATNVFQGARDNRPCYCFHASSLACHEQPRRLPFSSDDV